MLTPAATCDFSRIESRMAHMSAHQLTLLRASRMLSRKIGLGGRLAVLPTAIPALRLPVKGEPDAASRQGSAKDHPVPLTGRGAGCRRHPTTAQEVPSSRKPTGDRHKLNPPSQGLPVQA